MTKIYVRSANGILVMCDISSPRGLEIALKWKNKIQEFCEEINEKANIPFILVLNKIDLL